MSIRGKWGFWLNREQTVVTLTGVGAFLAGFGAISLASIPWVGSKISVALATLDARMSYSGLTLDASGSVGLVVQVVESETSFAVARVRVTEVSGGRTILDRTLSHRWVPVRIARPWGAREVEIDVIPTPGWFAQTFGTSILIAGASALGALAFAKWRRRGLELARSRGIAEMAEQVAHDIRSPLAALTAATGSLPDGDETQILKLAADRIHEIAENLLDHRRRQRRQAAPGSKAESVAEIVRKCVAEKNLETGSRFELKTRIDPAAEPFRTSSGGDLARVLSNLLNNAIEASSEGQPVVVELLRNRCQGFDLAIQDLGAGIPESVLEQVLIAGEGASLGKANGNGLGLIGAKRFAEGHGGRLAIRTEPGQGTCVRLELPA